MRWLCFFIPHKWVGAIDSEYVQCERCPKIKPKPRTRPELPRGTMACPYPNCQNWCAPPSVVANKDGTIITGWDTKCGHCGGGIRWTRARDRFGYYIEEFHEPIAIIVNQS